MSDIDWVYAVASADLEKLTRELDWNLLRTFMFIVQEGSITRAANRLRLRQPTISQALQRLENRIGTDLIERSPSKFRVTPAGEALYQECIEIFGTISRAVQTAKTTEDRLTGKITLAVTSGIQSDFYDSMLSDFHACNPDVTFEINVMSSKDVQRSILEKSAAVGLCLISDKHPRLKYEVLYRSYFGFFCGPTHPLFGQSKLRLSDLRDYSSVSFKTDQLWDALRPVALLRAQHKLDRNVVGYTSHLGEALRMIIAGLGFGPLPIHFAERYVVQKKLWRLPPYSNVPIIDMYAVCNPSARLNRAERTFLNMLQDRISDTPMTERNYVARDTLPSAGSARSVAPNVAGDSGSEPETAPMDDVRKNKEG